MQLMTIRDVEKKICWKKGKIYAMIKDGKFPRPYKLGSSSRWKESEVDEWITANLKPPTQ